YKRQGEVGTAGSVGNYVNFVISSAAWLYIVYLIWNLKLGKASEDLKKVIANMKLFVIFGWAIYPIGTAIQQFMVVNNSDKATLDNAVCIAAIIYVIADIVNKVGFGLVAMKALKKN
ncbi:MAG: hypothetical protein EB055_05010, partial [Micrococcales bacterium]|nr:hypothetical protein [Micrococcales bacterium]